MRGSLAPCASSWNKGTTITSGKRRLKNSYFQFKRFTIHQDKCQMKVCTDSCVFGSFVASRCLQQFDHHQSDAAEPPISILDVGHGTGLLTLMVAQALLSNEKLNVVMHGIELDESAFRQSLDNLELFHQEFPQAKDRIFFHVGSVETYGCDDEQDTTFRCIICNPPFFNSTPEKSRTSNVHAKHTVNISHEDLAISLSRLLDKNQANSSAWILLPAHEMSQFEQICSERHNLHPVSRLIVKDNPTQDRILRIITQFQWTKDGEIHVENLFIKDRPGTAIDCYSQHFTSLMKEYYLFL